MRKYWPMRSHRFSLESVGAALTGGGAVGAWLFGSAVDGEIRAGSDVDIAILFGRNPGLDELAACRARLQQALKFDDIDVIVLNKASVILQFQALLGTRVFCGDAAHCAQFASLTAREYEDEMAQCRRALDAAA